MLVLRALSVLSSLSALLFNLWNGLRSPCIWNVVFMTINTGRIAQLLAASKGTITLSSEEQQLYEVAFARFGVKLCDYVALLREASASWVEYPSGTVVVHQGAAMPTIWYLGTCHRSRSSCALAP